MTLERLKHLACEMRQAFHNKDYHELNKLVTENRLDISSLSATSDNAFNNELKSFIELYLEIQSHCKSELVSVSGDLKKFNKAKKGLEQYNKAAKRA